MTKKRFKHPTTIWVYPNSWTGVKDDVPEDYVGTDVKPREYRVIDKDKATDDCVFLQPWCADCDEHLSDLEPRMLHENDCYPTCHGDPWCNNQSMAYKPVEADK